MKRPDEGGPEEKGATLRAVLAVARAPFLALPVVLVAVGAAAAAYDGTFDPVRTLVALAGLLAMHAAVNALNEIGDYRSGIDLETRRTPFSGGSGALPEGRVPLGTARVVAGVSLAAGGAVGLWFLAVVGPALLPVLLLGGATVLLYTGRLTRLGVGEVAAGLGLGVLPVLGTALVQGGGLGPTAVAASVPPGLLTFELLLLNEFPDVEADRAGGRRHLVIRLGRRGAARVYAAAAVAVPVSLVVGVVSGLLPWPTLAALAASGALRRPLRWAARPETPVPIPALAANVRWILGTDLLLAAGLAVAAANGA